MRIIELERDGGVVDLAHPPLLAIDGELRRRRLDEVLVLIHVLVPEHEIVGGERRAVRPLHALAQIDRGVAAVLADLVTLGDARHDLRAGDVPEQQLVARADAITVLAVAWPEKSATPG